MEEVWRLLEENFDIFQYHGVDEYFCPENLVVDSKYQGRGIGEQLLKTNTIICHHFGIKLISSIFTSDFSNRIADRAGFYLDRKLRYIFG